MHRKVVAIGAFSAALLIILVMNAVLAPPRRGEAVRAVAPAAPEIGACGVLQGSELQLLDCAQIHTVEVALRWSAADPSAGPALSFAQCAAAVREYAGTPPAQDEDAHQANAWTVPLRYRQVIATGPDGGNLRGWSWQACLVAPTGPAPFSGYDGSIRHLPAAGAASSTLRVCYAEPAKAATVVPCTTAHIGEIIGTQPVSASSAEPDASPGGTLLQSCGTAAELATGAEDPTFDNRLRVVILSDLGGQATAPFSADIGVYYTAQGLSWLVCAVESSDGEILGDTVAGIGDGPLPLN